MVDEPGRRQDTVPAHVGIIMDGNGRWATRRGLPRTAGHREGLKAAKRVVAAASELGIPNLTLYTFSTENWKRTVDEVGFLMSLIADHLSAELQFYREKGIRIRHAGDLAGLPAKVQREIASVVEATKGFEGTCVTLAINYGGRDEILRAFRRWLEDRGNGDAAPTEADVAAHLDNPDIPDPDLIVRTAGELRMSNFLLWQSAYAEYYFTSKLWPDWDGADLEEAVRSFGSRTRKFGGLS